MDKKVCSVATFATMVTSVVVTASLLAAPANAQQKLWYSSPAADWMTQALPVGNGNCGGMIFMIFGSVPGERVQFNENSLWTGNEEDTGAYQNFGDVFIDLSHGAASEYRRELDIAQEIHRVSYASNGVRYQRKCFAASPME